VGESKFLGAESRVNGKVDGLVRPLKQQHLKGCIEEERGKRNRDDPSEGERGAERRAWKRDGEADTGAGSSNKEAGEVEFRCGECGVGDENEFEDVHAEGEEGRVAKGLRTPVRVTKQMRDDHGKTHTPFRIWCEFCVKARGVNKAHKRSAAEEEDEELSKVPRVAMDYFYMNTEDEEKQTNPVLVVVNEETGEKHAVAVGNKGVGEAKEDHWAVMDVSEELKVWGHPGGEGGKIILKSDGEASMVAFREALAKYHGGIVVPETSAKGESQSNGAAENAGRIVRDFTRVLKEQIEGLADVKLEPTSCILPWTIRWASMICSRYLVGKDGMTGQERRRGRRCKLAVVRHGEKVWYKEVREGKDRPNKLDSEVKVGVWLGHARNSNEVLIGTKEGVVRAYTVWRFPEGEQWDADMILNMKGTPQRPDPSKPGLQIPIRVRFDGPKEDEVRKSEPARREDERRRLRITAKDLQKYGYTDKCEGCKFKKLGWKEHRPHSEVCRRRLREAMEGDAEGKDKVRREDERAAEWLGENIQGNVNIPADGGRRSTGTSSTQNRQGSRQEHGRSTGTSNIQDGDSDTESRCPRDSEDELITEEVDEVMREAADQAKMLIDKVETELEKQLRSMMSRVDVTEVYSPPRVTAEAPRHKLNPGLAMDLTTGWDFTSERHRAAAVKYVETYKPLMLIGSPECRMFSSLQNLSQRKWDDGRKEELEEAKMHIRFVMSLYEMQTAAGRFFLHEHPIGASSWNMQEVQTVKMMNGVMTVVADQCMYGLKTWTHDKTKKDAPARKRTRFMTNCIEVAKRLTKTCDHTHAHQSLVEGRAKEAAIYPQALCEAICRGLADEKKNLTKSLMCLMTVGPRDKIDDGQARERKEKELHVEDGAEYMRAFDDVSGEELSSREVMRARLKELEYIRKKGVWKKITRRRAKELGIKIIKTRWIDVNKGDERNPLHRSRFVGKEFNDGKDATLFAATPPLEALRLLVSEAATDDGGHHRKVIMINDVARAYFEAKATRQLCVELPEEDKTEEDHYEDRVALLLKSLYGTRDAALNFQKEITELMVSIGFVQGKYNVCTYYHPRKNLRTMVHGDDFATAGGEEEVRWLKKKLEERFELKTIIIGSGEGEVREGRILNRVIRCTEKGWEYEADQRHAEYLVRAMNLQDAKAVSTAGEEDKPWKQQEEEVELDAAQSTEYRALAARANYLAVDRADIQFAVKELCKSMAKPTVGDKRKLKRLARYLVGRPRLVSRYDWQERQGELTGFSDSDWAGCKRTARSTSGGAIMAGGHLLKSWSSTQRSITLSSGEAELVAAVKMSAELIGMTQLTADWGLDYRGRVFVDSSAAIGVAQRKGNGKLRHVRVGTLWIQEKVEDGDLDISKVRGEDNPADAMTKNVSQDKLQRFVAMLSQEFREGRAEQSLELKARRGEGEVEKVTRAI